VSLDQPPGDGHNWISRISHTKEDLITSVIEVKCRAQGRLGEVIDSAQWPQDRNPDIRRLRANSLTANPCYDGKKAAAMSSGRKNAKGASCKNQSRHFAMSYAKSMTHQ
jgi:hypothetical protein